ncbi:response regulator [Stieleria sp. JC731]|uniref:response regulator n=1 Tax=Pirellulaceae TaxID=2691357 RepID=UPI001E3B8FB0|nr:response regulator [Stieleria sp. JC731]MCC9600042.1 response regulator [Stieleria sp. JC731]
MTSEIKNILIAEDNPGLARVLSFKFESYGFNPIVCDDGTSAWEAFEQTEIAAVVSDHEMPGLSGLELISLVRQSKPNVPCFLVTGRKLELVRDRRVIELGIHEVFGKPFSPVVVVETVAQIIENPTAPTAPVPPFVAIGISPGTASASMPGVHT